MGLKEAENKYQEKQKRRRGLQKTRFYCQICSRQCLDENGFKCHVKSEIHMRNLKKALEEGKGNGKDIINKYSQEFIEEFIRLLRITHGEKLIGLNRFYQEYIKNKDHIHLNSTKWASISSFAKFLQNNMEEYNCQVIRVGSNDGDDVIDGEKFLIAYRKKGTKDRAKARNENERMDVGIDEPIEYISNSITSASAVDGTGDSELELQIRAGEELLRAGERQRERAERAERAEPAQRAQPLAARNRRIGFSLKKKKNCR